MQTHYVSDCPEACLYAEAAVELATEPLAVPRERDLVVRLLNLRLVAERLRLGRLAPADARRAERTLLHLVTRLGDEVPA